MKRSHTLKIEDLQNSLLEGSIEEIGQKQAEEIKGGGYRNIACACSSASPIPWPPKPPRKDYV